MLKGGKQCNAMQSKAKKIKATLSKGIKENI
jgi:hypothetical protein